MLDRSGGYGLRVLDLQLSENPHDQLSSQIAAALSRTPSLKELHVSEDVPASETSSTLAQWFATSGPDLRALSYQVYIPRDKTLVRFQPVPQVKSLAEAQGSHALHGLSRLQHLMLRGVVFARLPFLTDLILASGQHNLFQLTLIDVSISDVDFVRLLGGATST